MKSNIFIACELVQAEQMTELDFVMNVKCERLTKHQKSLFIGIGYKVTYQDGQYAWIPKDLFEKFFRPISENENSLIAKSLIDSNDK